MREIAENGQNRGILDAAARKQEKKLLVCIVNRHQIVQFQQILARFPGSFSYVSEVTETMGNFKKIRH